MGAVDGNHRQEWSSGSQAFAPSGRPEQRALRAFGPRADRRSAFQAVRVMRVGGVTTCAVRSTALAGLETGVPSRLRREDEGGLGRLRACGPRAG